MANISEKGITPTHVHIEVNINKSQYTDYDTFLDKEALEYLKRIREGEKISQGTRLF